MEFKYTVLIASLCLLIYLLYKELSRPDRSQLVWRLIASVVLVGALAAMVLPLTYSREMPEKTTTLHLVTQGTAKQQLTGLKQPLYTLDPGLKVSNNNLTYLPDLAYYLSDHPEIKKINCYGYGLSPNDLAKLGQVAYQFEPAPIPSGFIEANWPQRLKESEWLRVQGRYHNGNINEVKLVLTGMGMAHDSVLVKAGEELDFTLTARPKLLGNALYHLLAISKKDTLSAEPVPFSVTGFTKPQILVIASAPDFENKFLKKWLFEQAYPLIVRSRTSKDKYSTDFFNTKKITVSAINMQLLKSISLLLIDEEEYKALSPQEKKAIAQRNAEGMGMVLRIDNAALKEPGRYKIEVPSQHTQAVRLKDGQQLSALPQTAGLFLKPAISSRPLVTDLQDRILVSSQLNGMGISIVSALSATYSWQLSGHKADYAAFWSSLLTTAMEKTKDYVNIRFEPGIFTVGQKTRLILSATNGNVPLIIAANHRLSPRQNKELPFEWDAYFWPSKTGWAELKVNQQPESYYVYEKQDWQDLKNAALRVANLNFVNKQKIRQTGANIQTDKITTEISKWWFFVAFLGAAAFLWYEQRKALQIG